MSDPTFEIERLTTIGRGSVVYGLRIVASGETHDFQIMVSPKGKSVRIYGWQDDAVTRIERYRDV